ncbi:MAG: sodium:calcium antiporter [Dehalococcoidia bacterium]
MAHAILALRREAASVKARNNARNWLWLGIAAALAIPAIYFRLAQIVADVELEPAPRAAVFGLAILGAAFVISWAAEAAQKDVSQTLAIAFLALIAVLPEYAVDLFFAWTAPDIPENRQFAVANMTGANRLLIGFGWPVVFALFWFKTKQKVLSIGRSHSLELSFLAVATLYSFTIPIKGHLSLIDSLVLISLFATYIYLASRRPVEEPELVGPAAAIGALPKAPRRIVLLLLFLYSGAIIFGSAEPFAEGLVEIGEEFGIEEFLLVQWLAPLASETPEFIIASLFVLRGQAGAAMGILIASKVNQWTLLVGSLPLAFSISGQDISPMDFDSRQVEEIFLTAAQSAFAVAVFLSFSLSRWKAAALFVLFGTQLFFADTTVRFGYGIGYLVLTAALLSWERRDVGPFVRSARQAMQETRLEAAAYDPASGEEASAGGPRREDDKEGG